MGALFHDEQLPPPLGRLDNNFFLFKQNTVSAALINEENFLCFLHMFLFYLRISLIVRDNVIISKCNKDKLSVDPSLT